MNVKQLISILSNKDPMMAVLLSSDEEGNNYGNLDSVALSDGDIRALVLFPDSAYAGPDELWK